MDRIKEYIKNNRKKFIVLAVMILCSIAFLVFVKNDYFLYDTPIVRVIEVEEEEYYDFGVDAPYYRQNITAEIMNGERKGEPLYFENIRTASGLNSYDIRVGDDVFVYLSTDGTVNSVDNIKRDTYAAMLFCIFVVALYIISSAQCGKVILATVINLGLFSLILQLRSQLINIFVLFAFGTIFFTVVTIFLTAGRNKKSLYAVISTLISVTLMMLIAAAVLRSNETYIAFETVDYITYLYDYKSIFYSGVLISGLGAIMDTSVIMATSINELIEKDPSIGTAELRNSAKAIAQDISGTIMNVLLFSCVVGALPSVIFVVCSGGMPLDFAIEYYAMAEVIRALVGCIGIILAVPVSYVVNIALRRRWAA